jgi:hypothetical protein
MKITASFNFLSLFAATVGVADSSLIVGAAATGARVGDSQYTPISIDVFCKGVNWKGLTIQEDDFSAKALMESYNTVHQELDGGDNFLSKVHFEDVRMLGLEEDYADDEADALEGKIQPPVKRYVLFL